MNSALFGGGVFIARWCKFALSNCTAINGLMLTREEKDDMFQARIDVFDMNETIFAELRTSVEYRRRVRNVIYVRTNVRT